MVIYISKMRFITANQIFSGTAFLSNDSVLVIDANNKIHDMVFTKDVEANNIEYFEGILCPGFVNTHCHLELSHLKDSIPQHTGIVDFGLGIIKQRNIILEEAQLQSMYEADAQMQAEGIVLVGDISNTKLSIAPKVSSKIKYHTFIELIGLNPENANLIFDKGREIHTGFILKDLDCSFAPHAPYSVSGELMQLICQMNNALQKPSSIHNQESEAENVFFETKTGDYVRLYNTLNLPIEYFKATGKSSLQSYLPFFQSSECNTLLVHNTFSSSQDVLFSNELSKNLFWCLCPNANLYIENALPPLDLLLQHHCNITLGTDSLASNHKLSIISEINTLLNANPSVSLESLLKAATYNGALFLGLENEYGQLLKNTPSGLNVLMGERGKYRVKKIL